MSDPKRSSNEAGKPAEKPESLIPEGFENSAPTFDKAHSLNDEFGYPLWATRRDDGLAGNSPGFVTEDMDDSKDEGGEEYDG